MVHAITYIQPVVLIIAFENQHFGRQINCLKIEYYNILNYSKYFSSSSNDARTLNRLRGFGNCSSSGQ